MNPAFPLSAAGDVPSRCEAVDWTFIRRELDAQGSAVFPGILTREECSAMAALYSEGDRFRKRVVMARHGFGRGEYQYFRYPLPDLTQTLRTQLYPGLADIANTWQEKLGLTIRYPRDHAEFLSRCRDAGQQKATPLLLEYHNGDHCCLHQDLYGEHVFPLQVVILLSEPGRDFEGGEFMLTEQRSQMASRAEVVPLRQGDAVVFAVNQRPVKSARGYARVAMRHGVSRLHRGTRHTAGIIFHDAQT
ncbi:MULTISPECIES: 2OG-Fe(II) oxygenase [Enterobacterales]|uniref:2OG-Fe(II) oxygenase n=1 Tax=Enterobacterales TaxID=91347 RepID=UPI0024AF5ACE|nr:MULTISPECIES: 2OG-Fe(II) oxygenase [Enterobacterales]MDI6934685.1 2OG-Fe(II) oxygenase [Serratia sp. Se-PFBMAAmG]MDI9225792.1 2OG-Fe(II) oxygenase [Serratia bockelmannii]MDI6948963.1 2OG-Fe(II) oxygenase [Serratia sp. Se-RSmG]MDI9223638.1 2OG-Fe(II) oxygenase [Pantoea sp. EA-12]MDI9265890.1 2OG-Fe(II) oxygenase [Serratia sp. PF2-63]